MWSFFQRTQCCGLALFKKWKYLVLLEKYLGSQLQHSQLCKKMKVPKLNFIGALVAIIGQKIDILTEIWFPHKHVWIQFGTDLRTRSMKFFQIIPFISLEGFVLKHFFFFLLFFLSTCWHLWPQFNQVDQIYPKNYKFKTV